MLYRIEKQRLAVALSFQDGSSVHGHIFVQPSPYGYNGHEAPIDLFNAEDPFLPLELDDGVVLLVAKRRVVEVSGVEPGDEDDLRLASMRSVTLELTLAGGLVRHGSVLLEMPSARPRLLDFLNQLSERFLPLYTDGGIVLINAQMIERVRPQD